MVSIRVLIAVVLILALCQDVLGRKIRPQSNRFSKKAGDDHAPLLYADTLYVWEDSAECIPPFDNDAHTDEIDFDSLSVSTLPSHGFAIKYEQFLCYYAFAGFSGDDSFHYSACDFNGLCEDAIVRVHVIASPDEPSLSDDYALVEENDYSITYDVLANDKDIDGPYIDRRSFKIVSSPRHGQAYVTPDLKIHYTPTWTDKVRYYGEDSLVYQICDQTRLCSEATLFIDVLDKCVACEKCRDNTNTFNLQRDRIHHFWSQQVYDSPHH